MLLNLHYTDPVKFVEDLSSEGFQQESVWNSINMRVPDQMGQGGLQVLSYNKFHFIRGQWEFHEKSYFKSKDLVGENDLVDFRVSNNTSIQSSWLDGKQRFEWEISKVNGIRIFVPKEYLADNKSEVHKNFEQYCFSQNIQSLLGNLLQIEPGDSTKAMLLESKFIEFIHYWLQYLNKKELDPSFEPLNSRQLGAIKDCYELILKNLNRHITISELSKSVGLNIQTLKRGFRMTHGLSIRQFMIKQRMEMAANLILKTDLPIQEICTQIGYCNRGHFAFHFQKFHGHAPADHRKLSNNNR